MGFMDVMEFIQSYGIIILFIGVDALIAYGVILRIVRARRDKKRGAVKAEMKRCAGRYMASLDPVTGLPMRIVGKAPIIEYVEDHFEKGISDEALGISKDKEEF
jgi:hypothetical protein